jgi:hypothetical protein
MSVDNRFELDSVFIYIKLNFDCLLVYYLQTINNFPARQCSK